MRNLRPAIALTVALAATVGPGFPAHAATAAPATVSVAGDVPACPHHPGVPRNASFVGTDGKVDVYRVPNRFGFTLVRVACG